MAPDSGTRIEAMYRGDRLGAWSFVVALWIVVGFVLFAMWGLIDQPGVRAVLALAAVLVLLFNTASIAAMVRHYREDKAFIYGLDVKHLDVLEARRRGAAAPLRAAERGT